MKTTGTNQGHLAKLLGLSDASVSRWFNGLQDIASDHAIRLSLISGVPAHLLVTNGKTAAMLKEYGSRPQTTRQNARDQGNVA